MSSEPRAGDMADAVLLDQMVEFFHADLRSIARRERRRVGGSHTLCTTALVNEAWLKLRRTAGWHSRAHFLSTASLAMRQVLINAAQARCAIKRGEGVQALDLDEVALPAAMDDDSLLELDAALQRLSSLSPRLAKVVECTFFAGFSEAETAEALGVTDRTVRRDWVKARAWLYRELGPPAAALPAPRD